MGMRVITNPLDPRFQGVTVEDPVEGECDRCYRPAVHECGVCGNVLCGRHAIRDSENNDWLCRSCASLLNDVARESERMMAHVAKVVIHVRQGSAS